MTVQELNADELAELRESYIISFSKEYDVSMEEVIAEYEGISFVKEDFFCNL